MPGSAGGEPRKPLTLATPRRLYHPRRPVCSTFILDSLSPVSEMAPSPDDVYSCCRRCWAQWASEALPAGGGGLACFRFHDYPASCLALPLAWVTLVGSLMAMMLAAVTWPTACLSAPRRPCWGTVAGIVLTVLLALWGPTPPTPTGGDVDETARLLASRTHIDLQTLPLTGGMVIAARRPQ